MKYHPHQSDLERLVPARIVYERLETQLLHEDVELLVPPGTLDGMTSAYGIPVRHVPGLDAIYVAHRCPTDWRSPP